MALREILTYPDPRLALKSTPVVTVTDETRALIDDMVETMYAADGVGLAAPQIGVTQRIIVVDCDPREDEAGQPLPKTPFAVVNPQVETSADGQPEEKNCDQPGVDMVSSAH